MAEYFDVLDERGNKTGQIKLRIEVHHDGDWHRAADIAIVNSVGEILLQKRSRIKDSYPGMWDISCGGHLEAGDDSRSAAVRELKEELNLDINPDDLRLVLEGKTSKRLSADFINNSFYDFYILRCDVPISEMTLQASEVDEVRFFKPAALKRMIEERDPELVEHDQIYRKLFEYLEENHWS